MNSTELAHRYIEDVITERMPVCKPVRQAVQRHLNDLETGKDRGLFFDERAAGKALAFFSFLRHTKGKWAGKPLELSPWQAFVVYCIFGWKFTDGTRRFRYSYVEVPRKNGKTTFAAGVALYMMVADAESGAEVYTGATTRDQARICFEEAQNMVRKAPDLQKRLTVYKYNIHSLATASKMEPVSSDYNTLDGLNPHCVILDELHAYKNSGLFDIFKSATGARAQPLVFMITTAGFNKEWFCYGLRKSILSILDGAVQDDSMFGMIYTLDENDDWQDPTVWAKANPNYGISVSEQYIKQECHSATIRPSERVNFLTKNLNVWTDAADVWIPDEIWMLGSNPIDEASLEGKVCYGGLDLASVSDFNCEALVFPADDGYFDVLLRCWIPEDTVKKRVENGLADLERWIEAGWVRVTPGNVTDYNILKRDILEDFQKFNYQSMAKDRWNSSHLVQELNDELGAVFREGKYVSKISDFGQGFQSMSTPTKELEKLALQGKIRHGGNPVLRWMLRNVMVRYDPSGNIKLDKEKSSEKIDGVVASVMALGEYLTFNWNQSDNIYEERGFIEL